MNTNVNGKGCGESTALGAIGIEDRKQSYGREISRLLQSRWKRLLGEALSYVDARDLEENAQ